VLLAVLPRLAGGAGLGLDKEVLEEQRGKELAKKHGEIRAELELEGDGLGEREGEGGGKGRGKRSARLA